MIGDEIREIAGFASILIDAPLKHSHPIGTRVVKLPPLTTTRAAMPGFPLIFPDSRMMITTTSTFTSTSTTRTTTLMATSSSASGTARSHVYDINIAATPPPTGVYDSTRRRVPLTTVTTTSLRFVTVRNTYCTNDITNNFNMYAAGQHTDAECEALCASWDDCLLYEMRCATQCILLTSCVEEAPSGCGSLLTYIKPSCMDTVVDWKDQFNKKCSDYKDSKWCTASGDYGAGWYQPWGTFRDFGDSHDHSADKVCCSCGGGHRSLRRGKQLTVASEGKKAEGEVGELGSD